VKILTQAGLDEGTVRIRLPSSMSVEKVQARTIHSDGSVAEFDGRVYKAPAGAEQGSRLSDTTFTLPAVEVGSILEYRYHVRGDRMLVYDRRWLLSEHLFTKAARFTLVPYRGLLMRMSWPSGLPPGVKPPTKTRDFYILEGNDFPPLVREEFAPPAPELTFHVDIIYSNTLGSRDSIETNPALYWNEYAKLAYPGMQRFTDSTRALRKAVEQIVQPGDSEETKLRKIYARVQQVRNVPRGSRWTEQETKEDNDHPIHSAEDVWKQGRGGYLDRSELFLALARIAGMQADLLLSSRRDEQFFNPRLLNSSLLSGRVIAVKVGDRELYLEPGLGNLPFGMLQWDMTDVQALRIRPDGGEWVTLPLAKPDDSRIDRQVVLQLSSSRVLEGTAEVRFTGSEALWRRVRERDEDAAARKAFLESNVAEAIPVPCTVKLLNEPDWDGSDAPLVAKVSLSIPEWTQPAGSRSLFKVGLFSDAQRTAFITPERTQEIYFWYPYTLHDDVVFQLPPGWHVQSVPKPANADVKAFRYQSTAIEQGGALHVTREFTIDALLIPKEQYSGVKAFFDFVRAADEERAVISASDPPPK
jgi:hypothetical protein